MILSSKSHLLVLKSSRSFEGEFADSNSADITLWHLAYGKIRINCTKQAMKQVNNLNCITLIGTNLSNKEELSGSCVLKLFYMQCVRQSCNAVTGHLIVM
jgi:hypothetical protein